LKTRTAPIAAAILLAGCASAGPTAPPLPAATAATATPTTAATTAPTAAATAGTPATVLEGTWAATTTCEQQAAAVDGGGFTAAQQAAAGWDGATCMDMGHGTEMQIRFAGQRLLIFQDGTIGWDGRFQVVDTDTFQAGDYDNGFYITYDYDLDGDRLTIDMLSNEYPTSDPAELAGEQIAQTVIYESAPFEKVP
jgi:hypothetical protein